MTAEKLQSYARVLSNSGWCRYWLNWSSSENPIMAIQVINSAGVPQEITDAEASGLTLSVDYIYTAPRTNEDGTPYKASIY